MKSSDIKIVIEKHNLLASNAITNTNQHTQKRELVAYKTYIENNDIIKPIIEKIKNHEMEKQAIKTNGNGLFLPNYTDELSNMHVYYLFFNMLLEEKTDVTALAVSQYFRCERNVNNMIRMMLNDYLQPLVNYIQQELNAIFYRTQENKKIPQTVINGDVVSGIMQKGNEQATVNIDNSKKKFVFNGPNFVLGIASAVAVELISWGIIELIKLLIN